MVFHGVKKNSLAKLHRQHNMSTMDPLLYCGIDDDSDDGSDAESSAEASDEAEKQISKKPKLDFSTLKKFGYEGAPPGKQESTPPPTPPPEPELVPVETSEAEELSRAQAIAKLTARPKALTPTESKAIAARAAAKERGDQKSKPKEHRVGRYFVPSTGMFMVRIA